MVHTDPARHAPSIKELIAALRAPPVPSAETVELLNSLVAQLHDAGREDWAAA